MLKTFFITVLTLFVFPQVGWGEIYVVDPAHTHVGFSVKHLVISNVKGKFNTFSGWVETDGKGGIVKAFFEIESASIDTGHVKRDKHLRSSDFLDVEKYPSLIFKYKETKARNGNHYVIVGDLSLHGVTKSVTLNMELLGKVKDPWGNFRAGITGTTEINRKDFGIVWNKLLEAGGLLVGNVVKINLEVEGILKKEKSE